ncbi:MAG: hypothetical protein CVT88_09670 [Candidatus Altiarchaeales archaeon HGW-Altiarchaeales-1]|nr:MAG: hypothetical protein CVT88_09670 [Candidatus Altiarchaeales archaeon HGW-Altiarchaeales-1]
MFDNLLTKENIWGYLNIVVAYLLFFPIPEDFINFKFVILTFGCLIIFSEISSLKMLHKFLFKRLLAISEIELRKINPKYDFDDIKKEDKDEIDKIDKYFLKHSTKFSNILLIIFMFIILAFFQLLGISQIKLIFVFQNFNIYSQYIIVAFLIINTILAYSVRTPLDSRMNASTPSFI